LGYAGEPGPLKRAVTIESAGGGGDGKKIEVKKQLSRTRELISKEGKNYAGAEEVELQEKDLTGTVGKMKDAA